MLGFPPTSFFVGNIDKQENISKTGNIAKNKYVLRTNLPVSPVWSHIIDAPCHIVEIERQQLEHYILGDNWKGENIHIRKNRLSKNWEK